MAPSVDNVWPYFLESGPEGGYMLLCALFFSLYCKMCSFCKLKEIRPTVWETKCRHFPGGPPVIIIKSLPDLRIHNTVSCQRKGIQYKRAHNKFLYCECLGNSCNPHLPTPLTQGQQAP